MYNGNNMLSYVSRTSRDIFRIIDVINTQADICCDSDSFNREGATSIALKKMEDSSSFINRFNNKRNIMFLSKEVQFANKAALDIISEIESGIEFVGSFYQSYFCNFELSAAPSTVMGGSRLRFVDFDIISENTFEFVLNKGLLEGIIWLHNVAPNFFPGSNFQIDLLSAGDDGDEELLALKVFGSFDTSNFRERRHRLVQAMVTADQKALFDVISIFQRRIPNSGWQTISYFSELVAE